MKERIKDAFYIGHTAIVWFGSIAQIYHVFTHESAIDLTLMWVACLVLSEIVALPRAMGSKFFVWKLCHIGGIVLMAILLLGVILYG